MNQPLKIYFTKKQLKQFLKEFRGGGLVEIKALQKILKNKTNLVFIHCSLIQITCDLSPSGVRGFFWARNVFMNGEPLINLYT